MDVHNDQDWETKEGGTLALEDMAPSHRRNVIAWLHRHARQLQLAEGMAFCSGALPNPDSAAWDMVIGGIHEQFGMDATEWLEDTPLMRRLRELEES